MKILHIEAGKNLYGGALQVFYLLEGLKRLKGSEVENILICPSDCELAKRSDALATVYAMPMKGDLDFGLKARIRQVIQREKPDLVHVHSRRGADIWGLWAARTENVPVICSRRVDNPEPAWLAQFKYSKFNKVITISEGIRQVLLQEGVPEERVTCVHSAVDTEQYQPIQNGEDATWFREEFGLQDNSLVIANLAQMIKRKGQEVLIGSFASIVEDFPHAVLMLFGKGPKQEDYQALVKDLGLQDKVIFPGFRTDIGRILPNVDVVVHPATMEGLGVALLQSAACGKPIVATDAGGIPEIVEHDLNGYLIEVGDGDELSHYVRLLLGDNALRQKLGHAGRDKVLSEFSINAMTLGNFALYEQVLADS